MARCTHTLSTALHLVVVLGTIVTRDAAASPVYRQKSVQIAVKTPVDFQSPGFPVCCDDKNLFYRVVCVPDYPGQPCYLRMVFSDVDMTPGSSIKIYEGPVLIESISQVGPVHRDAWYRPVVASNTGELALHVHLVASAGTKRHMGFKANITRATVPGLQNWPDRPIMTECPEAHTVQHGSVRMRRFSREDRIHDCAWVLRGPQDCTMYISIYTSAPMSYDIQIGSQTWRAGYSSDLVYSMHSTLYVHVRKLVNAGEFIMHYGCYTHQYETSPTSQECFSRSISLFGGFECHGVCVPGPARCNGVKECYNAPDEIGCFKGVTPTGADPYNMPSGNGTIVSCFGPAWEHGGYMYLFIILPVVLLLWVACVCYFCIKKKARLRRSNLGPPTEGDPPPTYHIAIQHVKPELDLLASLPSYEEVCSPSDAPPKYRPSELLPVHTGCKKSTSKKK